jgi:hypothetical protein
MADGTMGNAATNRASNAAVGYTFLTYQNAATKNGKLYKVDFYVFNVAATKDLQIKVFREVGANFVQVGSDSLISTVSTGLNTVTLATPIDVLIGDYIAFYTNATNWVQMDEDSSGGNTYYVASEVSGTLAKASWTASAKIESLYGYIKLPIKGGFSGFGNNWVF